MKQNKLSGLLYVSIIMGLFSADELIKLWVEESGNFTEKELLDGTIKLEKLHNYGAANGILKNHPLALRIVSAIMLVIGIVRLCVLNLHKNGSALEKMGLSLLIGGALSNITDRFIKGFVTDYFRIMKLPGRLKKLVFNISDFNIFIGSILISAGQIKAK